MKKLLALAAITGLLAPAGPAAAALDLTAAMTSESSAAALARSLAADTAPHPQAATTRQPDGETSQLPEPKSWAMLLGGFALLGIMLRLRNRGAANSAV